MNGIIPTVTNVFDYQITNNVSIDTLYGDGLSTSKGDEVLMLMKFQFFLPQINNPAIMYSPKNE